MVKEKILNRIKFDEETLKFFPNCTEEELSEILEHVLDNELFLEENLTSRKALLKKFPKIGEKELKSIFVLLSLSDTTNLKDIFAKRLKEEDFVQVDKENGFRVVKTKDFNKVNKNKKVRALFEKSFSVSPVNMPLYNSGIWVSLKPPSPSQKDDFILAVKNEQIELGRSTGGLVYDNYSVINRNLVIDFFLSLVTKTNISDLEDVYDLKTLIRLSDFNTILQALTLLNQPRGMNIILPCSNTFNKDEDRGISCSNVAELTVDPSELLYINRSLLNDEQIAHMSKRAPNSITIEEVKYYQDSLEDINTKISEFELGDNLLKIKLRTPNLLQSVESGMVWVNSIVNDLNKVLDTDLSLKTKNEKYFERSKITILNNVKHYIEWIKDEDLQIFDSSDEKEFDELFDNLSSDDYTVSKLVNLVTEFIESDTVTIVGMKNYICPSCRSNGYDEEKETIKSFNVLSNFLQQYTLTVMKLKQR